MATHTNKVTMGGDTFEVVYDDEENLVYKRPTTEQLVTNLFDDSEQFTSLNDRKTVGRTSENILPRLREYADRCDLDVAEVDVTPVYLRELAEEVEMETLDGYESVTLVAIDDCPLVVTSDSLLEDYVLCPRLPNGKYPHEQE